jgi:amino acid permease
MSNLFSGRFIWCLASALVFIVMSVKGMLAPDKVTEIIIVIVMAYFGRTDRASQTGGK